MEHWIRLVASNNAIYVAVFVFALGVVIWLVWARFCPDRYGLLRASHFVMALAAVVLFGAGYCHVVANGLDGVACAAGRYSRHATCFTRDDSPMRFWAVAAALLFFCGALLLASVACVKLAVSPAKRRVTPSEGSDSRSSAPALKELHPKGVGWWSLTRVLSGMTVALPLAWIAAVFHQADGAREQVAEALASAAGRQVAVEGYLRDKGVLPEDNEALGLPSPANLPGRHLSETEIFRGSIIMTFDGTVDEHLRGRVVLLVAVRRHQAVTWHCTSPYIDDRYLPRECRMY